MPARYVIHKQGIIRAADVNADLNTQARAFRNAQAIAEAEFGRSRLATRFHVREPKENPMQPEEFDLAQVAVIAGLPYSVLRDISTIPTLVEGFAAPVLIRGCVARRSEATNTPAA